MRWLAFKIALFCVAAVAQPCLGVADPAASQPAQWRTLEPGLDVGEFVAQRPSTTGDSRITVLRIDPVRFTLGLYSANALSLPKALPIDGWMRDRKLVAAINAGMFERDGSTTGYARIGSHVLQPARKKSYNAYFALQPDAAALPRVAILDADCDDVAALEPRYRVVLQSMRMIDCNGNNVWHPSGRAWSTAALGVDGSGRVLFIMARAPWDVHDFIDNLKALPIGLTRAMYLEGGPEVSLAVDAGGVSFVRIGSWETGFNENDNNDQAWALPNIIGVQRKEGVR